MEGHRAMVAMKATSSDPFWRQLQNEVGLIYDLRQHVNVNRGLGLE